MTGSRFKGATVFDSEDVTLTEINRLTDISMKADINYVPDENHTVEAGALIKRMSMDYQFGESNQIWYDLDVEGYHNSVSHPGEFRWTKSPTAAGYVVIVEALGVSSLPVTAEPLTGELDRLLDLQKSLKGQVDADSLEVLGRQITDLREFFDENITLVNEAGETTRFLREREQQDWIEQEEKDWTEGKLWREKRSDLYNGRVLDYWMPADSTRSDFWWLGVRFEGDYQVTLQTVDENYFDYYTTLFNGNTGADADFGPIFHVDGGTGVFGSYTSDSFRVFSRRGD